jgi:hypothetical protein
MEKTPIFIIGCPRSGTTLLRVILDSHPNICCGPETHLIKNMKLIRDRIIERWDMLKPYGIEEKELNLKIQEILTLFTNNYLKIKNKNRWAEKTPDNIFYVSEINKFFPNCQFINIIRDGRDVVCSYKERWGRTAIFLGMKKWNSSIEATYRYRKMFQNNRYIEIRYEDFVTRPKYETKRIMNFLDEEWSPDLLEHHKSDHDFWFKFNNETKDNNKIEKHPLRHSPSKPIFSSSVGKWKKNLNLFEKILINTYLHKNLKKLGYK